MTDNSGETALHQAVSREHLEIAELLLKHGADPLIEDIHGYNVYDHAKENKGYELLRKNLSDLFSEKGSVKTEFKASLSLAF